MTYQVRSRSYCVNLDNGTTFWKKRYNRNFKNLLTGIDNYIFLMGQPKDTLQNYDTCVGNEININVGEIKEFLVTNIDFNSGGEVNKITEIGYIKPFRRNGNIYI